MSSWMRVAHRCRDADSAPGNADIARCDHQRRDAPRRVVRPIPAVHAVADADGGWLVRRELDGQCADSLGRYRGDRGGALGWIAFGQVAEELKGRGAADVRPICQTYFVTPDKC